MGLIDRVRRITGFGQIHRVVLPPIPGVPPDDPILKRVDENIDWYDYTARLAMRRYHRMRFFQLLAGAALPVTQVAFIGVVARVLAAVLGGFIVIVQGMESAWHDAEHYPAWRSTAEELKRQRFFFSVRAGPYANPPENKTALVLLAENSEALTEEEQQRWQATQAKSEGDGATEG